MTPHRILMEGDWPRQLDHKGDIPGHAIYEPDRQQHATARIKWQQGRTSPVLADTRTTRAILHGGMRV